MEELSLNTLADLPLFQGIGKSDLSRFTSSVPHSVVKIGAGEELAKQDQPCRKLAITFKGTVGMCTMSPNKRFAFYERIQSPYALQPEALYGISPYYTHTYTAQTEVSALVIPKEGVTKLFSHFEVFRLNIINLLSTHIYRQSKWLWRDSSGSTEKRITNFIQAHCVYPAGEKALDISMQDLGAQINEPRMNVSYALNGLQEKNLVLLKRRRIIIPAMEKLIQTVQS